MKTIVTLKDFRSRQQLKQVQAQAAAASGSSKLEAKATFGSHLPQIAEKTSRAWAEVDLAAVCSNALAFSELLPQHGRLMAVVKANAYGHGDVRVAQALSHAGIANFAVASLSEGMRLRNQGILGNILILGYTEPAYADLLHRYQLVQTVVDAEHAELLNRQGKKLRVHLAVDTGMHRLGIAAADVEGIAKIYSYTNLSVEGIFSHLSMSDDLGEAATFYTEQQIACFDKLVEELSQRGINAQQRHLQASYGVLNYPELAYEYARVGIGLYGVLSSSGQTREWPRLQPALSVKARIITLRSIAAGEGVGYGQSFVAGKDMRIAVVGIGYADGIPRSFSEQQAEVLVRGQRVPLIGRICMDQLMIDVSQLPEVASGDVVTIIGQDGEQVIRCEEVAMKCGTISNEILSRLGERLEVVYSG